MNPQPLQIFYANTDEISKYCIAHTSEYINAVSTFQKLLWAQIAIIILVLCLFGLWYFRRRTNESQQKPEGEERAQDSTDEV